MKQTTVRILLPLMVLIMVLAAGCASYIEEGGKAVIIASSEAFKNFSGEYENTAYFKKHKPKTIAVLPFQDLEQKLYSIDFNEEDPAGIVRRGMYNHISSLPFKDLEIFQTDRRLKNAGISDTRDVDRMIKENPKKLKSILGVDAVVSGQVTHFDRIFVGIYSQVAVGCKVRMWDLKTGNLLWQADHISRAHAGGISLSPVGLALATVAAVWNLQGTAMLSQTDELFREIVSTVDVPESALALQSPPPRIDMVAAINSGKPLTLGEKAAFRVIGDPGCSAYVDLGDFKSTIPLAPVSPSVKEALRVEVLDAIKKNYRDTGHELTPGLIAAVEKELASREIYEGHYSIEPGEQAYGLIAKAYLIDAGGGQATAIDAAHLVDIDALPPVVTTGVSATSLDGKIKLVWTSNAEADLRGYEIWTSPTPLSGYTAALKTERNEALIGGLPNFTRLYVQVRAVDKAANSGPFSSPVEGVPLPEPGLYDLPQPGPVLGGAIAGKVLLTADKNPYTVLSNLDVSPGGGLYLEPGVILEFAPDTVLAVSGGNLLAYGSRDKPIYFRPKSSRGEPGAWQGVVLDGAARAVMRNVVIDDAATGLSILNSAPTISALRVNGSSQAGLVLGDGARPNITCSVFNANKGQGGVVIDGEGLAPVIRNNVFDNNDPFQVQSYSPLQIDLKGNYWGRPTPVADWFLGNVVWDPALTAPPQPCPAD